MEVVRKQKCYNCDCKSDKNHHLYNKYLNIIGDVSLYQIEEIKEANEAT